MIIIETTRPISEPQWKAIHEEFQKAKADSKYPVILDVGLKVIYFPEDDEKSVARVEE